MDDLPPASPEPARPAPDLPFLRNPQGWEFFLEVVEAAPGQWRGGVRIRTGDLGTTCRLLCTEHRSDEAEALQDAKTFAQTAFDRIALRMRWLDAPERAAQGGSALQ